MFHPIHHLLQEDLPIFGGSEICSDTDMQHICKPVRFKTGSTFSPRSHQSVTWTLVLELITPKLLNLSHVEGESLTIIR